MDNLKSRSARMSKKQKEHLITYLETHKMMLETKVAPRDLEKIKEYWIEIATELNSLPGAKKDIRQWKEALNEVKTTARKKARLLHRDHTGTGGGPKTAKDLTDLEERLLALLSRTVVTGIPGVEELGFGNNEVPGPAEIENVENIEIIIEEMVPSTSTDNSGLVKNVLQPRLQENVTVNKVPATGRKKNSIETQIQKIATNHEECLKNMADSNDRLAESNNRLAKAILRKKNKIKGPVLSLTF